MSGPLGTLGPEREITWQMPRVYLNYQLETKKTLILKTTGKPSHISNPLGPPLYRYAKESPRNPQHLWPLPHLREQPTLEE